MIRGGNTKTWISCDEDQQTIRYDYWQRKRSAGWAGETQTRMVGQIWPGRWLPDESISGWFDVPEEAVEEEERAMRGS